MTDTAIQPKRRGRPSKAESGAIHQRIIKTAKNNPMATQLQIAEQVGVNRSTVSEVLAKYGESKAEIDEYKANQADILMGIQRKISANVTEEDIQKATFKDKMVGLGIAIDKYRLITGESTSNVNQWLVVVQQAQSRTVDITPS